ncbi:hypothetical protein NA57DRAFT_70062 [Rhizodiscina lignyota]|uniref:Up-regulated during septation protein 1 domain-containing protein n=1 Tax=Rhizodiscina lignyota TaxID=1504668 RepID=A0A9P4IR53_9PEZI|nr:hypothetical protein NA57DRAFT_70062 [Rhizodiscina lignyota]
MQNGGYNRPVYQNPAAMNGYGNYANYAPSPSASSMYSPVVPHSGPQLQAPLQDPDLLPSNARYGLSGTARQTPPSDALLNGYTNRMINGVNYRSENGGGPALGHQRKMSQLLNINDPVAMHLLVETALGDSITYDVLSFDEVERLKKELNALAPRIESVRKRLALESKVRDAALSLNRLYRKNSESPKANRRSSTSAPSRKERESINKTEDELNSANKKCADLSRELYSLEARQQKCQTQLLMHTAGVLQMTHNGPVAKRNLQEFQNVPEGMVNGINGGRPDSPASIYTYENSRIDRNLTRGDRDDFDDRSLYKTPDEMYSFPFDGSSKTERSMHIQKDLATLGHRLEDLNARLKDAITQANDGNAAVSPLEAPQEGETATMASVTRQMDSMAQNLDTLAATTSSLSQENRELEFSLQQSQQQVNDALAQKEYALQQSQQQMNDVLIQKDQEYEEVIAQQNADIERYRINAANMELQMGEVQQRSATMLDPDILLRIEFFNKQLYGLLNASHAAGFKQQETPPPPSFDERDPDAEVEYMERAIGSLSRLYQDLLNIAEGARAREEQNEIDRERAVLEKERADQMETTLVGLWSIVLAGEEDEIERIRAAGEEDDMVFDPNEQFSLPSFSKKVQWLVGQSTELREQLIKYEGQYNAAKEELLEQMANMERDKGEEITNAHSLREEKERELTNAHSMRQEKEQELMAIHAQLETARGHESRVAELEQQLQAQEEELKTMQDALEASRATTAERQNTLQSLRQQLVQKDEEMTTMRNEPRSSNEDKEEIERLESELVDITSELTLAKAELDTATAERQKALQSVQQQLAQKDAEVTTMRDAPKGSDEDKQEIERLETELIRLTTELTIAKAELDGAYGSRAERKKEVDGETQRALEEAQAQIATLQAQMNGGRGPSAREKELEDELKDTLKEFEELTKASVEAERDRDKLEAVIDGLREKIEGTEAALNEERVRWLGVKSPGDGGGEKPELTSVTTMRAEFKKMMRETRLEGVKALRAEQEERKKLEQQLKQVRRDQQGAKQSGLRQMFSAVTG